MKFRLIFLILLHMFLVVNSYQHNAGYVEASELDRDKKACVFRKAFKFTFDSASLKKKKVSLKEAGEFDKITLKGCVVLEHLSDNGFSTGAPALPAKFIKIWVPRYAEFKACGIESASTVTVASKFRPAYIRPAVRLGDPIPPTSPDATIYSQQTEFPQGKVTYLETVDVRGYKMFSLRINVVQYLPAQRKLLINKEITIWIEYTLTDKKGTTVKPARKSGLFEKMVGEMVVNPEEVRFEPGVPLKSRGDEVKYLIVTPESYTDGFEPLARWKTKKGVPAEIVTTEHIDANYTGADLQEKIKNCIDEYVAQKGTEWVVLGGDSDTVPPRIYHVSYAGLTDDTPGDIYYSSNNVFVGRVSVRSSSQAEAYSQKVLRYEREVPATNYAKDLLMSGAQLYTWGDAESFSNMAYNESIAPYWEPTRKEDLFDSTGGVDLTTSVLISKLNEGWNFFHMYTHGSTEGWALENAGFGTHSASALSNYDELSVIYTGACNSCGFDKASACLGEAFTLNDGGGAIAYIGSSRINFIMDDITGVPMRLYSESFYKNIFSGGYYHIGQAYQLHKGCPGSCDWLDKSLNLLGDPEFLVWTENPEELTLVYPEEEIGLGEQVLELETLPRANVCYLKGEYNAPEVYAHGSANSSGIYSATINPTTAGTLHITVTKHNYYPYEATIDVSDDVIDDIHIVTDLLPDGYVNKPYSKQLEVTGGQAPYSWSITSGNLPEGLSLKSNIGEISGTPAVEGTSTFVTQVTDSNSTADTKDLSITITDGTPPPDLRIITTSLDDGVVNIPYSKQLEVTGGQAPYNWSITSGNLPEGLSLNSSIGEISGTPTVEGTFTFVTQATDSNSNADTKNLSITITDGTPPPDLRIITTSLDDGVVNVPYNATLEAEGGTTPYTWSIVGALPGVLELKNRTGIISGKPIEAGTYNFTVQVTDSDSSPNSATKVLSIVVNPDGNGGGYDVIDGGCDCTMSQTPSKTASTTGALLPYLILLVLVIGTRLKNRRGRR